MTINTCELTKTIEKLVEKDEKEFESGLKNFIQDTNDDEKRFAQKYSEIQISYLGASDTRKSLLIAIVIFMFSTGLAYALPYLLENIKTNLYYIGVFYIFLSLIIIFKPEYLKYLNSSIKKSELKHFKEIIIKIEEGKYR